MKKIITIISLLLINNPGNAQSKTLDAYWDDGLKFQSKDSLYKFSFGGRVHYDASFTKQSFALDTIFENVGDRIEVRRARLSFEGSINKALTYEFEFTFGETIRYADMYFAFLNVPYFDRLTIGHFREPFGMEEVTSSNAIVFMERSLTSAFGPSRNTGIMVQKEFNDKLKGYAGVFRITDDLGGDLSGEGNHSFSTRWVFNPLLNPLQNKVMHVGLSLNTFKPKAMEYEVESRNEVNTGVKYLSTGDIKNVENVTQVGGEFGYSKDKLTIQSEYIHAFARVAEPNTKKTFKNFSGSYAMASYFFQKGIRKYNRNGNRFSSISVSRPSAQESRRDTMNGAWEAAIRVSHLNISDANMAKDKMTNATLGLNWYYNSNTRLMANYVITRLTNNYNVNALQVRLQLTF